jgi:diguanylate cyclase (GGDEF)-like protein
VFKSLVSRIVGLGVLILCALLALTALLLTSSRHMGDSYAWVSHTQRVLRATAEPVYLVRQVESELRSTAISEDSTNRRDLKPLLDRAAGHLDELVRLTADNPVQNDRAKALRSALLQRSALMMETRSGASQHPSRSDEARTLMAQVERYREALVATEERLLVARSREAAQRSAWNRTLLMIGVPVMGLLIALALAIIVRTIRHPARALVEAMEAMDATNSAPPLDHRRMQSREFARIARGYNAMIERLDEARTLHVDSEKRLQALNHELKDRSADLEARNQVIERLGLMAHRMQAARTDEELAEVVSRFLPRILPGLPGAVYAHNNSRNLLVQIASWGTPFGATDRFSPDECWALRLGQSHWLNGGDEDVACKHVEDRSTYHCEPLLAGGEVIGLLYLAAAVEPEMLFRLKAVAEDISSALVNHRLQRDLREQTIRDPLTGLFNRRYLEEALKTEIARSTRSRAPMTVVMCDVDHFKCFNDEHGHDAGDHVLKAVAAEMQAFFRGGDVVCRYGGEEFTVIAPGTTPEALSGRIDRLRLSIGNLQLHFGGRALGSVSVSFGLAAFVENMASDGSTLLQAADEALYRAKREGRNRAVIAQAAPGASRRLVQDPAERQ